VNSLFRQCPDENWRSAADRPFLTEDRSEWLPYREDRNHIRKKWKSRLPVKNE